MTNINSYIRKTTLKEKDYSDIQSLPYEDQIEIFKERALKLYKLKDIELNPDRYKQSEIMKAKKDIQKVYKTRSTRQEPVCHRSRFVTDLGLETLTMSRRKSETTS